MYTLSINCNGHDGSIALLKDNQVVFFVMEERVSRIKYCKTPSFKSVELIKKYTDHIDLLIFPWLHFNSIEKIMPLIENETTWLDNEEKDQVYVLLKEMKKSQITFNEVIIGNLYNKSSISHHTYHAASAFYMSGLNDAICLVIDGKGSRLPQHLTKINNISRHANETSSIYSASYPNNFSPIYKRYHLTDKKVKMRSELMKKCEFDIEVSQDPDIGFLYDHVTCLLGWNSFQCGKTMGLAAYGTPNELSIDPENFKEGECLNFQTRANLAYNVQKHLEKVFLQRAKYCFEHSKNRNLVLSGGVALNVLGASLIKKHYPEFNIYVDPIAADGTIAVGSALYHYYEKTKDTRPTKLSSIYLGPEYKNEDLRNHVHHYVKKFNEANNETIK